MACSIFNSSLYIGITSETEGLGIAAMIPGSRFSVLGSRFPVLGSQFPSPCPSPAFPSRSPKRELRRRAENQESTLDPGPTFAPSQPTVPLALADPGYAAPSPA